MGFNKRHIDKEIIVSAFKDNGAKGIINLYKADAIFMPADSTVCNYIDKIVCNDDTIKNKQRLIEDYMTQLLEGLYKFN